MDAAREKWTGITAEAALHVLASCLYKGRNEQEHNITNYKAVIHNVVPSRQHTHASLNISRYRFHKGYHCFVFSELDLIWRCRDGTLRSGVCVYAYGMCVCACACA